MKMRIALIRLLALTVLSTIMILAGGILNPNAATAATYYVATTGSDSNSCSAAKNISTPKRNITGTSGGISCLTAAGDKLLLRAGTYAEVLDNNYFTLPSGTSWTNSTWIGAYNKETVIIRPPSSFGIGIVQAGLQYLTIDGLIVDGTDGSNEAGLVVWGGAQANHIRIQNTEIKNAFADGVFIGGNDIELLYDKIHDNGRCSPSCSAPAPHGVYSTGTNALIDHCLFYNNTQYALQLYHYGCSNCTDGSVVSNNTAHNNNLGGLFDAGIVLSSGTNLRAYGNVIHDEQHGIDIYGSTANTVLVYNNVIYNNLDSGIVFDSGPTSGQVYNNTIYNNAGVGIDVQGGAVNSILKNNIVYNNGGTIVVDPTATGTVQSNNLTTNPNFVNAV